MMPFMNVAQGALEDSAARFQTIGAELATQNGAAASMILAVVPPASDPASAALAARLAEHAASFQTTSFSQAQLRFNEIIGGINGSGQAYEDTDLNALNALNSLDLD